MAAHESLAAGLIGLWAAIFAGWLAYSGIQMQIEEDRRKIALSQIAAKQAAITAITQVIHPAAMTLYAVTQAQKAQDQQQIAHWDDLREKGVGFIEAGLDQWTVKEAVRDLRIDDRAIYVAIIATFVTIHKNPSDHLNRAARLKNQRDTLLNLREYLQKFDSDLAAVYDKDAQIEQQS